MIRTKNLEGSYMEVPLSAIPTALNLIFLIGIISYSLGKSKVRSVP